MAKRSAQEVIDQLIRENKPNEHTLYAFAMIFVGLGTGCFIYSVITGHWALSIGSAFETGLFYPAMNAVQKIRRENQTIRLLELALTNASTAEDAAAAALARLKGGLRFPPQAVPQKSLTTSKPLRLAPRHVRVDLGGYAFANPTSKPNGINAGDQQWQRQTFSAHMMIFARCYAWPGWRSASTALDDVTATCYNSCGARYAKPERSPRLKRPRRPQ